MRAALALAVVLGTAAAAWAQPASLPGTGGCAAHQAAFPALAGLTEAEAVTAIEAMPGIRTLRVAGRAAPMTRDYRPERATLLLRDGRVEKVVCG
ncbi:hypothetical protein ACFQS7_25125 [Dankookia sp. GCM10030260]|uniref:hypothetical protein n=1 Tax=Dankookia sp. GCM10030260 TaxID=3273390 RepID=UPI003609EA15